MHRPHWGTGSARTHRRSPPCSCPANEGRSAGTSSAHSSAPEDEAVSIAIGPTEVLDDDDAQLALWILYELHYRGFDDVAEDREWDLGLLRPAQDARAPLRARAARSRRHRRSLASRTPVTSRPAPRPDRRGRRPLGGGVPAAERVAGAARRLPARAQRAAAQGVRPAVVRAPPASPERPRPPSPSCSTTSTAAAGPSDCTPPSTPTRSGPPGSTTPTAPTSTRSRRSPWPTPT